MEQEVKYFWLFENAPVSFTWSASAVPINAANTHRSVMGRSGGWFLDVHAGRRMASGRPGLSAGVPEKSGDSRSQAGGQQGTGVSRSLAETIIVGSSRAEGIAAIIS